jgi:hypothetical protein
MCYSNISANRFHVLGHLYDEGSGEDEDLTDAACHGTSPICFGDYLAIEEDRRGAHCKKNIRRQKLIENQNRRRKNTGNGCYARRGTCSTGLDLGSNASLQSKTVEHVDDPLVEEIDSDWFKSCKGKLVRQNLDPLLEYR